MADKKYLLSLDFGTGAGRCYLISTDGQSHFEEYQEWTYEYPAEAQPGGSEFDAQAFWQILAGLIRKALHKAGISGADVLGISSTSQREGMVFLDKDGGELYAGPNLDMRAPDDISAFQANFAEKIHASSGHWPFPMFLPYRLLWFQQHKPEIYEKVHSVVLLNNWMLYRLCGVAATEPSNGVETLLVNFESRQWNRQLIAEMGFNPDIFPPVYESGTQIGVVTSQAAAETGLAAGTPVVLGGSDSQCGLTGSGLVEDGGIGVVLGTYGPLQMIVPDPVLAEPELLWSGCHIVPGKWVIESTSMEAGQTFRWVRDVFYSGEQGDVYARMSQEAAQSSIGANQVLAYLGPRLPNYRNLEFVCPGGFSLRLPTTPGRNTRADFSRAALEAVSFGVKLNAERLQRAAQRRMTSLNASGGLSKSEVLLESLANLLQVTVNVPKQKEGSAVGAAICAGVGAGIFADMQAGVRSLVQTEKVIQPDAAKAAQYQSLFESWMEHYVEMYGENILTE